MSKEKKIPSNKINGTKNALFFLSQAPTHHSFTFNSLFLYELKHKVRLSKKVSRIFHFWLRLVLIKVYRIRIIVQNSLCSNFSSAVRVSAPQAKISQLCNFTWQLFLLWVNSQFEFFLLAASRIAKCKPLI